jgi:two-component system, OmpR family, alkaline phosphatase synthesis response regulator PhoP
VKVLVVDDEWPMRLLVKLNLESERVQVLEAENGAAGVELAQSEHPDVILLDVMMPGTDGFETAEILSGDARTSEIPIVFLSARVLPSEQLRGLGLGAADYITKPFKPVVLREAVERLLADKKAGRLDFERTEKIRRLQQLRQLSEIRGRASPSPRSSASPWL